VHEEVRVAPVDGDEAVALFNVEPLDRSLSHRVVLPVLGGSSGHTDRSSVGSKGYVDCRPTMTGAGRSLVACQLCIAG
jgi:hypothetical protein